MQVYVTFFSVGTNSEALIIDHFQTITEEIVVWESKEQYFAERSDSFDIIDGGMHVYYLAAGVSAIPDALLSNQIVSYRAPSALLGLLKVLDSVVQALRVSGWPEWPEEEDAPETMEEEQ